MPAALNRLSIKLKLLLALGLGLLVLAGIWFFGTRLGKVPYKIGVILSHTEVSKEEMNVISYLIDKRLEEMNRNGGINGRPVEVFYLDDQGNTATLVKLAEAAVQDKNLVALVGGQGIARALALGPLVTRHQMPYIGNYVYTQYATQFPTMYTANLGYKEGRLLFRELLRARATRIGFIGEEGAPHSEAFLAGLKTLEAQKEGYSLTFHTFFPKGHELKEPEMQNLADSLREKVDFLVFTNEEKSIYPVLETMAKNQLRIPVYCGLIDIAQLDAGNPYFKTAELFDFNSLGIPGTYNKQLHQKLPEFRLDLKQESDREYQLGLAGSLADMVGLVGEAAAAQAEDLPIRATINESLKQYIHGQRIFRGWFSDLYFTAEHAFAGNILVAWKPRNHTLPVLAPMQFLIADTILNPTQVLYTSLDMVRIDQVNDEEEAFLATFYLQIKTDQELDIDQLDFTNASRNAIDHEPLLEARLIRTRQDTTGLKFRHYLYKISGKFQFDPDLKEYPLDQQAFPISIQPGNALKPFLIQPAHPSNRDTIFQANGWTYKYQYVGFDKEIISSSNAFSLVRKNIPYYKFTFEYVMKRLPIDYFLKTLMPLFTILTIAYMSVYIPPREFEALAAIQVTALLSSIALYFSTYKPQIQYATSSDKIFIFSYVMVTTLIGSSILIYIIRRRSPFLKRVAQVYQRILFPLIIFGFTVYIRWF